MNDKVLLIKEIKKYTGDMYFIDLCSSLFDEKKMKKILINNDYGIIGNILNKNKELLDDEILKEMCINDILNDYYNKELYEELDSLKLAKDLNWIKNEVRRF